MDVIQEVNKPIAEVFFACLASPTFVIATIMLMFFLLSQRKIIFQSCISEPYNSSRYRCVEKFRKSYERQEITYFLCEKASLCEFSR